MCGRLVVSEPDLSVFVDQFGVQQFEVAEWLPRYNLAPTELAPLITNEPVRRLTLARFGLVPSWAEAAQTGHKMINARVETVATRKAYRRALALRRGVVPVSGYFEWRASPQGKRPLFIHAANGEPLLLAGVWECWHARQSAAVESFAVLTQPAAGFLSAIHTRMPLTLTREEVEVWLAPEERSASELAPILNRTPDVSPLAAREVSRLVNSVDNDEPACLDPAPPDPPPRQLSLFDAVDRPR
jgi:putative SOS response-associated peptidase YedK